ncbi:nicotinamide riboside kinase 1 [Anticarsia gemmatalis]|uniref:nicotinamide riboside kinase 1 n=1 Tax=Anticarsia gemmatalis TaxID=129554 RepID=UPI003F772F5F
MAHRNEWVVIGISGVTCGGKTSLSNRLRDVIVPVYIFHQDKYFYPDDSPHHVKCGTLDHNNYDILSSVDMDSLYKDVCSTMDGDDKSHESNQLDGDDKFKIAGKKFLIVEGFTVLNFEPIVKLCDFSYYFVLEYGECAARRCFRVYDPPDIPGYFETCVWPEHLKYRAQIEKDHRVKILDGTAQNSLEIVLSDLNSLLKT